MFLFVGYSFTMNLMMYIGNDLIESIPLDLEKIRKPGYVGSFKRCLKMKYNELIRQHAEPPEFLVISLTPVTVQTKEAKSLQHSFQQKQ